MKFGHFSSARKELINFFFFFVGRGGGWRGGGLWWTDLKSRILFSSILSMALQCHKIKLLSRFFGLSNLPFRLNKEIKSQIWTLFARSKEIDQFFFGGGAYMESSIQCYPKVCMVLQCHKIKLLWWFFGSTNFLFVQKKVIKCEIWTLFTRSKEIDQFLRGL